LFKIHIQALQNERYRNSKVELNAVQRYHTWKSMAHFVTTTQCSLNKKLNEGCIFPVNIMLNLEDDDRDSS